MFCVTRRFSSLSSVEEAAKRAETGVGPILRRNPGFRGYYVVDGGDGVGVSITVFESQEAAEASREEVMGWIEKNLADLYREPPQITAGEVIVTVEAEGAPSREAGAGAAPEARPH
jgi:heme-degrading monooxygenase HmoA